ncbi:GntR family transcriptional regulator [Aestuariibacter halophilus]|uniref:GntR family transcriptional regulator n=1 Tax=Fluctibacter halophilus TaxID=226011 RepID=A0ABS8G4J6_9ALTE|nr:S1-like domain-containing RNA-binding protein [Aestuariibacter halophilus]MCC2615363.1 GntR family transcriptional regulator [Aestuariibacter halophilus]
MLHIGKINTLRAIDALPFGFYLQGDDPEWVLLPRDAAPASLAIGDSLDVLVYHDKEGQLVATQASPTALRDQCALMTVKHISDAGAFVEWLDDKDLLVPHKEQDKPLQQGLAYMVYVTLDAQRERLIGSTRLHRFLSEKGQDFSPRQAVTLTAVARTDLGMKVIINDTHLGLLFKDELIKPLSVGERCDGFIKRIRDDGKIDVSLQLHDEQARQDLGEAIIDDLRAHGGISTLTDKSAPNDILQRFGVSKGAYKKALGNLYKQQRIRLEKDRITLIEP